MCCWYDYWNTAPGPADGSDQEFLPWFLDQVRAADEAFGQRTLDVVDVHFYPQGDVFNDWLDPDTSARRIRSVRALWDPDYVDESWIGAPIAFVPRILAIIDEHYPDTPLAITEWNFGAEEAMNGAIAIADVLGVYGREGDTAAAYWRSPDVNSPGYFAFKMHGNYDDAGTAFEGAVVPVSTSDVDTMDVFAAIDADDGVLRLMFVNKRPDQAVTVDLVVDGFTVSGESAAVHVRSVESRRDRRRHADAGVATRGAGRIDRRDRGAGPVTARHRRIRGGIRPPIRYCPS